jgi:adenylate kinase
MKAGTSVGLRAKEYVDQGQLVPDEVMIELVRDRIAQPDCEGGFILDGFPRTVAQAEALGEFCELDVIFNLTIQDEAIVKRLSGRRVCGDCGATYHTSRLGGRLNCEQCGGALILRKDDAPETVLNRLAVYHKQTAPLEAYYEATGKMTALDGALALDEGVRHIANVLENVR